VPLPAGAGTVELRLRRVPQAVHPRAALVAVHRPDEDRALCADRLRELYGLTRTQANVVLALVRTPGLAPVAEALGLSPNTVRAHLKQVFAKCGVRSRPELLQRLALGAARRGGDGT
jgi:DNA-binding CsgD family transcriptional regulator